MSGTGTAWCAECGTCRECPCQVDWFTTNHPETDEERVERETIARVVAFIRSQSGWDDGPSRYVTHPCPFRLAAAIERGEWKGEP